MPMYPAAREGDPTTHDGASPSGQLGPPVVPAGRGRVLIEGQPAAHLGSTVQCTGATAGGPLHPPLPVPAPPLAGSPNVWIHDRPAVRWTPSGDLGGCGAQIGLPALAATRHVFIGGPTSVAPEQLLSAIHQVVFRLVDAGTGAPYGDVPVVVEYPDRTRHTHRTDADGYVRLRDMPAGCYHVAEIQHPFGARGSARQRTEG